jgi:formylglycine-generating enzyme required for sulfatase activity
MNNSKIPFLSLSIQSPAGLFLLAFTLLCHLSQGPSLLSSLHADDFGEGDLKFHISFVPIAGNAPSTNFFGDSMPYIDYDFRIGKTEVSIAQLLQARAADARIVRREVADFFNSGREKERGQYIESNQPKFGVHAPAASINIIECFKFCNWLTSGDPYQGAYKLIPNPNPYDDTLDANDYVDVEAAIAEFGTVYTVPTFAEWYKAGFMKPDGSGFSFYTDGLGSGNVIFKELEWFQNEYGKSPKDIMLTGANQEKLIRYYDAEGNEQIITPTKGPGGWNSHFQDYPWAVGSSTREQNGTYDMFGNVGEYFQDITDFPSWNSFKILASNWNLAIESNAEMGSEHYRSSDGKNDLEAFRPAYYGEEKVYSLGAKYGLKNVGFRVVARGAVPAVEPMPEVQWTITDGAAHLHWESTLGRIYQIQYSYSLNTPN